MADRTKRKKITANEPHNRTVQKYRAQSPQTSTDVGAQRACCTIGKR